MVKFLIAGLRRTGTGLIRTTLNDHPQIHCAGELFNFGSRINRRRGMKCSEGYRQFIGRSHSRHLIDLANRKYLVNEFLEQYYQSHTDTASGFKLQSTQLRRFPMVIEWLKQNDCKVIQVVRRNILKTLVSRSAKRVSGESHVRTRTKKTNVHLEEESLIRHLERIEQRNNGWVELCEGMPYLTVYYEDFVENQVEELKPILDFLEVEHRSELSSKFVKGNSDNLCEIIDNYDRVAEILAGTPYEKYLDQ